MREAKSVFEQATAQWMLKHGGENRDTNVAACNAPGGDFCMRVRNMTTCALGLAAALSLSSSVAQSQDTTRLRRPSEQRITVSKGEVLPPRVDTVFVTRYDTVRVNNTIVRVDTVTVTPPPPPPRLFGPWYWGLFAGPSWPTGNIDRVYTNGFHAGGIVGWEQRDGWFGARLDGFMNQLGREHFNDIIVNGQNVTQNFIGSGTPLLFNLALDLKVKPINTVGWGLYAVGGGNYNRFRGIALASDGDVVDPSAENRCDFIVNAHCFQSADTDWSDKWGYNFGAGLDFHIGGQDMYLETRWFTTNANGANSWVVPISLGLRYFSRQ